MNKIALVTSYIAFLSLSPDQISPNQSAIRIYQNDTSQVDDGEIWGSSLRLFFIKDEHILLATSHSRDLSNELLRVKSLLNKTKSDKTDDYYWYDFAFILPSKDTLYTDRKFHRWRSGTKRALIASPINAYVNTAFAR
jgi:hypothetical protein